MVTRQSCRDGQRGGGYEADANAGGKVNERLCIHKERTILQGIQRLNEISDKFFLIVDERGRLFGTVTDGDIRRAIANQVSFSDPVAVICKSKF